MKATGVVRRIDDLGRIVIPKEMRKTLRIREGESLEIFAQGDEIVLKKFSSSVDLQPISQNLIDTIALTIKSSIFITDRDYFIAGSGSLKKKFLTKTISPKLEELLLENERYHKQNVAYQDIVVTEEEAKEKYNYLLYPILADGETVGLVLLMSKTEEDFTEEEEHLIQIISQFLGKYLEE